MDIDLNVEVDSGEEVDIVGMIDPPPNSKDEDPGDVEVVDELENRAGVGMEMKVTEIANQRSSILWGMIPLT